MAIDFNRWGGDPPRSEIDYEGLKRHALSNAESVLQAWLPGGKIVGREYVCGDIRGGNGTSCSTNIQTGVGSDFAADLVWSDLIALVSQVDSVPMHEAALRLAKHIGVDLKKPLPSLPPVYAESPDEKYARGRETAWKMYEAAEVVVPTDHPYLVRKNIRPADGVRVYKDLLLVPLFDERKEFWSVQRIYPDGAKKITDGGKLSGNMFGFFGDSRVVYLAEGMATAATVHELTGKTAYMCISSGNMPAAAEALSRLYPFSVLVIAGDNDEAGRKAAAKAQEKSPRFKALFPPHKGDDWNDFALKNKDMTIRLLHVPTKEPMLVDINAIDLAEPKFLVEDAVETPGTGMVFGPSGSGKSFFALDLSLHCATGREWLGKPVKEGPVIYLCGEGRHGVPRRVAAWKKVHGPLPDERFFMSRCRVQFDPDSVCEMADEINRLAESSTPPVLIVIDTMARALPGDCDENSARDTMAFVDMCDRLQAQYDCVVLIVHHTGHSETAAKRARGSSALKGAMDFEILLDKERGIIEWIKTKDAEPHLPIRYELVKTPYGDGPREHSCVVKYDVQYDPITEQMTKPAKVGAKTLATLCHKLGTTAIHEEVWRKEFYTEHGGSPAAKRQAFRRAKTDLAGIRYIDIRGDTVHVRAEKLQGDAIEQAMFGHLLNPIQKMP